MGLYALIVKRCAMRKMTVRILAGALAIATVGTLAGCSSGTSYGVAYRSDYYDGPVYHRHYRPYYDRYYGPRSSFSFSYRD